MKKQRAREREKESENKREDSISIVVYFFDERKSILGPIVIGKVQFLMNPIEKVS